VSLDPDQATVHFTANPVSGGALDQDLPATHLRTDVAAGIAMNLDGTPSHALADEVDPREVSLEVHSAVRRITAELEEIAQRQPLVTVIDREALDLRQRPLEHLIGYHSLNLDGYGRFPRVAQCQCHSETRTLARALEDRHFTCPEDHVVN